MALTPLHKTGYYYLIAAHSGMPLGISGIMLKQRDFRTAKPEEIRFAFFPAGPYVYLSPVSGEAPEHCFMVDNESPDDKAGLTLRPYEGNRQHTQFRFMPVPGGGYRIMAAHSRKFLDVYLASKEDKAALVQHTLSHARNQVFFVYYITTPVLENNRLVLGERNRWEDLLPRMVRAEKAEEILAQLNVLVREGFPHATWRRINEPQYREHVALREILEMIPCLYNQLQEHRSFDCMRWLNTYGTPLQEAQPFLEDPGAFIDLGTLALLLWYACYLHADHLPPASPDTDNRTYFADRIRYCLWMYRHLWEYSWGGEVSRKTVEEYVASESHETFRRQITSKAVEGKGEWAQTWECLVIDYGVYQQKSGYLDHVARADFAVKQRKQRNEAWFRAMTRYINGPRRYWDAFMPGSGAQPEPTVVYQTVMGIYGGMYGHHRLGRPHEKKLKEISIYSRKGGSVTGLGLRYEGEPQETVYGQKGDHREGIGISESEYISSAFGFGKDIIDCLCFSTNTGRTIAGGNFKGRDTAFGFSADLPDGLEARLVALEGHHNTDCIEQLSFVWEYEC